MTISSMISMVPAEGIEPPTFGLQNRISNRPETSKNNSKHLVFQGLKQLFCLGKGGEVGRNQRFSQPQNQDHLFPPPSRVEAGR